MKATAFWDVYGVIILVDFIPPSLTANASAYQETLNRLKEAIQKRDQDC
jgi:predicted component of type VI protein secretion system